MALVIAARTTHVVNCRMRLYWKKHTKYRKSGKGLKVGETRVMAVTFKMKDWYLTQKSEPRSRRAGRLCWPNQRWWECQ